MWSGPVSGLRDDAQRAVLCRGPRDREQARSDRSEEHTSELQSPCNLVCRLLLEKKKKYYIYGPFGRPLNHYLPSPPDARQPDGLTIVSLESVSVEYVLSSIFSREAWMVSDSIRY